MPLIEVNFDGIVGPSHNYAGLSLGNIASATHAGHISHPRAAALQGIAKMRANLDLGLTQGILLPHHRPNTDWLASLATDTDQADHRIYAAAMSASAMWAANAATMSPAPDTHDGRCHLTVANLMTMSHRSHEWPATRAQLKIAFGHDHFVVHDPIPAPFSDEGAANHMRLCSRHGHEGVEVFVYGVQGGPFPARQHSEASKAVACRHGVKNALFVEQSEIAIATGAFHNDVVAVANENVLFAHEHAFADKDRFYTELQRQISDLIIIEVPERIISLKDAIQSYVFNAQLVTLADQTMAFILPLESKEQPAIWQWLEHLVAGNGPIRHLIPVDVRQSMANGGGPACLRLRIVCDPAVVDPRFLVDHTKLDHIEAIVARYWPDTIHPSELRNTPLIADIAHARSTLLEAVNLSELSG